jgi:L-asparaginase
VLAFTTGDPSTRSTVATGELHVGSPCLPKLLAEAQSQLLVDVVEVLRKDSLDLTAEDRMKIRQQILGSSHRLVLITHGTDTMVDTATALRDVSDRTIILTGALQPAQHAAFRRRFHHRSSPGSPPTAAGRDIHRHQWSGPRFQ